MPTALYRYTAYGLSVDSDIPLPELLPLEARRDEVRAQTDDSRTVSIRLGAVDLSSAPTPLGGNVQWARPRDICLIYPEVGAYRITEGRLITVDLIPDADDRTVRLYLLGPV